MKWYVGQSIVAIRNSQCGTIKKGQEFKIAGIKQSKCSCNNLLLDVGLITPNLYRKCNTCGTTGYTHGDHTFWKKETIFAPLDQDISELINLLKKPLIEIR